MSRIRIGTNLLENCDNPIVISGNPLFSYTVEPEGIKLSFIISSPPANTSIKVKDNIIMEGKVEIKTDKKATSIILEGKKIIELIHLEDSDDVVNLDLRPLELHIYADDKGLYIGGSQLSGNVIKNCKNGIAIGG